MKHKYLFAVFASVLILLMTSCISQTPSSLNAGSTDSKSGAERDSSVIFIATQPDREPFEYVDDDGDYGGFDVALAVKLCEELERTPVFVSEYGDSLYDVLNCGTAEMTVSSLVQSDKAKQKVDFTEEYITLSSAIVTNVYDSILINESSLKNAPSVGVVSGSYSAEYASGTLGLTNVTEYRNFDEAKDAFFERSCYALLVDEYLAEEVEQRSTEVVIRQRNIGEVKYSIAVAKGNTELLRILNEKISRFKTDGTLLELRRAYLGGDKELNELFMSEIKAVQNKG